MLFGKKDKHLIACEKCGTLTPKSKLRKSRHCGIILCKKCRKQHACEPQSQSVQYQYRGPVLHVDEQNGQTIIMKGNFHNPQSYIKMTDMRIYELARNPDLMSPEEELVILSDVDINRRYMKYREEIKKQGF